MDIAIIGGGFTGLTAGFDLLSAGHQVTVYEAANQVGGLASGFSEEHWDWKLERYYHHIFTSDKHIINLAKSIGAQESIFFNRPKTAFFCFEHGSHEASITGILRNPHMRFLNRIRYGLSALQLKLRSDWRNLETMTAEEHLMRWAGDSAYHQMWQPLLNGKFGPHASEINAAWVWARIKSRSFQLGYFTGGFQAFAETLANVVTEQLGGKIYTNSPVQRLDQIGDKWLVRASEAVQQYDRIIVASGPMVLKRLTPMLPEDYLREIDKLKSMGAVVLVISLTDQLLTDGSYWLMPPKGQFPYVNVVEHTNMISPSHYGNDRIVYLGDYLPISHRYFSLSETELKREWTASLQWLNPNFQINWVKKTWLFREKYAQPIVPVNHSRNVPSLHTPLKGLFFASMSHVYPWDRGTNFAVELGHRVATQLMQS